MMATQAQAFPTTRPLWRRTLWPLAIGGLLLVAALLSGLLPIATRQFPAELNLGLRGPCTSSAR
jgi:hypothetical protein